MARNNNIIKLTEIVSKIYIIRGKKVIFDSDLAIYYNVLTKNLNKAVTRNITRFPSDFMFQLTNDEFNNLKFHFGTSSWGGKRKLPRVFTEHGILMLSSVLRSERAIQVNIQIMRTFTKLREWILSNKDLKTKIEKLEKKYDKQFQIVFEAIKQLFDPVKPKKKYKIGFRAD